MTRLYLPEWSPQLATALVWPHSSTDWAEWLPDVEPVYGHLVAHLSQHNPVIVICLHSGHQQQVIARMAAYDINHENLIFHLCLYNDTWIRDYGPISVLDNGELRWMHFQFDGWGNKYQADLDNRIAESLASNPQVKALYDRASPGKNTPIVEQSNLVLEGGAIETDGEGTLLTTRQCLLSSQRNPQLSQTKLETHLRSALGIDRILWLDHGHLSGDDTDGHIDTLARFCNPSTICYQACDAPNDEHFAAFDRMEKQLKGFSTRHGDPYQLIALPWPQAKFGVNGDRLPASYANFLITNESVLVPTYQDPADEQALEALQKGFPHQRVIGLDCLPLIQQFGSLHCITMHLPYTLGDE